MRKRLDGDKCLVGIEAGVCELVVVLWHIGGWEVLGGKRKRRTQKVRKL